MDRESFLNDQIILVQFCDRKAKRITHILLKQVSNVNEHEILVYFSFESDVVILERRVFRLSASSGLLM